MDKRHLMLKGYHGTLMGSAKRIQQEGFLPSTKEIEWLGEGIYFFTELGHANSWAKQQQKKLKFVDLPVVLCVEIVTDSVGLLDLDIPETKQAFENEMCDVLDKWKKESGGVPNFHNDSRKMRCFFCNLYASIHNEVKIIAYSFPRIHTDSDSLGFPSVIHSRQLCVRDKTCIKVPPRILDELEAV